MNQYPIRGIRTRRWKYLQNLRPDSEHHTHIDRGQSPDGNGYWQSWQEKSTLDDNAREIVRRYFHRLAEELYDLKNDPFELHNLAQQAPFARRVELLRCELDRWMLQQGDKGLETEQSAARELMQLKQHQ